METITYKGKVFASVKNINKELEGLEKLEARIKKEIKETKENREYAKSLKNENVELLYEGRIAGLKTALKIIKGG